MSTPQFVSVACLIAGIVLIILGINAADSFSSDVSNFFTGSPTDKAIWLLIGGAALLIFGLFGTLRGHR